MYLTTGFPVPISESADGVNVMSVSGRGNAECSLGKGERVCVRQREARGGAERPHGEQGQAAAVARQTARNVVIQGHGHRRAFVGCESRAWWVIR